MAAATRERARVPIQVNVEGLEIGPGDTVVDIGCGDGAVCAYAGRLGAAVVGIDMKQEALDEAAEALRGLPAPSWRLIASRCDPIPLPDDFASVVVCTEVLEHIDLPARLLAELARIGKPNARYVISVPDPISESLMRIVAPPIYWQDHNHIHVYEHKELDDLIRGAGLEIEMRGVQGFAWAFWWVLRLALEEENDDVADRSPLLNHWGAVWNKLTATPRGPQVAEALDRLIPKSQVVLARKPETAGMPLAPGVREPAWSRSLSRWKRRLRDGVLRLPRHDIRWSIRRVAR
jgi:SAM-dependent methyltransferase